MLGGEGLTSGARRQIDAALGNAQRFSDLVFEAYVGSTEGDPREHALRLHHRLPMPDRSVLVLCDPVGRSLEIVTGRRARRHLDDGACRLAVATMTSYFLAGDLPGGLVRGIQQLGEAAHHPQTLHAVGLV